MKYNRRFFDYEKSHDNTLTFVKHNTNLPMIDKIKFIDFLTLSLRNFDLSFRRRCRLMRIFLSKLQFFYLECVKFIKIQIYYLF